MTNQVRRRTVLAEPAPPQSQRRSLVLRHEGAAPRPRPVRPPTARLLVTAHDAEPVHPRGRRSRVAAIEHQVAPPPGMVWGEVHDEIAWSFNGVAGHAGVFSTAAGLSVLAQTLLNGGAYGRHRILRPASVQQMITNENTEFADDAYGLRFELDQRWYMGGLSSLADRGPHRLTGTSVVIDVPSRSFVIVLTNRVHPSRSWGSVNPARVASAQGLTQALRVRPRSGRTAWLSGTGDARTATLTVALPRLERAARLRWEQLVDTGTGDPLTLQVSTDGATWFTLPYRCGSEPVTGPSTRSGLRRWLPASAKLPPGAVTVRWTYTQDELLSGRGVFLDGVVVRDGRDVLVDTERDPKGVRTDGWTLTTGGPGP